MFEASKFCNMEENVKKHTLSNRIALFAGTGFALSPFARPLVAAPDHRPLQREERRDERRDEWVQLGERRVDHKAERDTIEVGNREGHFRAIKLQVKDADLDLQHITVVFGNGDKEELDFHQEIRANSETRAIDLTGKVRDIRQVVLTYKTPRDERRRALVTVFGVR
jgi:hypothetical protein